MADSIIKEFVKKQTTPITIGIPRKKPVEYVAEKRIEPEPEPIQVSETNNATASIAASEQQTVIKQKPHVGRPKSDIEKVKLSLYVPAEAKNKLIRIQHDNYKQNLNDVLLEAINDYIKKKSR